jgi:RimJ/RimL family protein N-acetyltransferase
MLQGKRVRLRPIERSDLSRFVKWLSDPEVLDGLSLYLPISEAQEERWFEDNLARPPAEQVWAVEAQISAAGAGLLPSASEPGWTLIGSCGFNELDWRNHSAECGIVIGDKAQWGKGYGTDAMLTLLGLGFGELNLHRIMLRVYADNARAIRSYEKAGFKEEGRLRESDFHNGRYRDTVLMAILRSEWEPR